MDVHRWLVHACKEFTETEAWAERRPCSPSWEGSRVSGLGWLLKNGLTNGKTWTIYSGEKDQHMQKLGHKECQVICWGLQADRAAGLWHKRVGWWGKQEPSHRSIFVPCCWAWTSPCKAMKRHQIVFNNGLMWPAFHSRTSIWMVEKMMNGD